MDLTKAVSASAKAQKLVEQAISIIPRLETVEQYWKWRSVVEDELAKFCLETNDAMVTIHWTLSTNILVNLHGRHPTLNQCRRRLTAEQALKLVNGCALLQPRPSMQGRY